MSSNYLRAFMLPVLAALAMCAAALMASNSFADADTGRDVRTTTNTSESYYRETTIVTYRDTLDGGEGSADLANAAITGVTELTTGGFANVSVSGRFSASGATAVIVCTRWHKDSAGALTFKSMSTATMTANTTYTIGGDFVATNSEPFDTQGADVVKILVADPSTGDVNLFAEVY